MTLRAIFGMLFCLTPGAAATWLLLREPAPDPRFDPITTGLVSGSVIAAIIFLAETLRDRRAARDSEFQALRLQLSVTQDLSGVDIRGHRLIGLSLRGRTLRNAHLADCDMRGMDLSYADFRGANLARANLSGCLLNGADLRLVDARGANFSNATLINADLRGGMFGGANLTQVSAQGVDCRPITHKQLHKLRARHGVIYASHVSGLEWPSTPAGYITRLDHVRAWDSSWSSARLNHASLYKADFYYAHLGGTEVAERRGNTHLSLISLIEAVLIPSQRIHSAHRFGPTVPPNIGADFSDTELTGAEFDSTTGDPVKLTAQQVQSLAIPPRLASAIPERAPHSGDIVSEGDNPRRTDN